MLCLPLQDFITIRSVFGTTIVTQPETGWLALYAFEDIVAFLDVKQLRPPPRPTMPLGPPIGRLRNGGSTFAPPPPPGFPTPSGSPFAGGIPKPPLSLP